MKVGIFLQKEKEKKRKIDKSNKGGERERVF